MLAVFTESLFELKDSGTADFCARVAILGTPQLLIITALSASKIIFVLNLFIEIDIFS